MGAVLEDNECPFPDVEVVSRITGTGMNVPDRVIKNEYFENYLDTSDEWIRERTGIVERRWAEADVTVSELSEPAARTAISAADLSPSDIDGIIFATVTPERIFPSSACYLQKRLGIEQCLAFDVNAVCSGFIYALVTADSLIRSGLARNILVVGADLYSRILDMKDRGTCVLFGDGAGAVVLSAVGDSRDSGIPISQGVVGSGGEIRGIYANALSANGAYTELLYSDYRSPAPPNANEESFPSRSSDQRYLSMDGREVFKQAVRKLGEASKEILAINGFSIEQVDHFVSHQANLRILQAIGKQLGVSQDKVPVNIDRYGNTSAATIPLLLAEMEQQGTLSAGDLVLLSAFGSGFTWGVSLLRW